MESMLIEPELENPGTTQIHTAQILSDWDQREGDGGNWPSSWVPCPDVELGSVARSPAREEELT